MSGWGVFLRDGSTEPVRIALVKERGAIWMGDEGDAKNKAAELNTRATNPHWRYIALAFKDAGM